MNYTALRFLASNLAKGVGQCKMLALPELHPYNPLTGIMLSRVLPFDGR
jgi:hypothetical protein